MIQTNLFSSSKNIEKQNFNERNTEFVKNIDIENSWKELLLPEFESKYFKHLVEKVRKAYKDRIIYPPGNKIFRAFNLSSFHNTKVVIIGQDPYHGPNQANGLCFAVNDNIPFPPSLKNIFEEVKSNTLSHVASRNLEHWAKQGVLLLNSILTVESRKPGSHSDIGWQTFTDAVIKLISEKKSNIVFLLWGAYAIKKKELIDSNKHLILTSPHPSPFSANRGFFGNKHFSKTNEYLSKFNIKTIIW